MKYETWSLLPPPPYGRTRYRTRIKNAFTSFALTPVFVDSSAVDGSNSTDRRKRPFRQYQRRSTRAATVHPVVRENDAVTVVRRRRRRRQSVCARRRRPRATSDSAADRGEEVRAAVPGLRVASTGQAYVVDGRTTIRHHSRDGTLFFILFVFSIGSTL